MNVSTAAPARKPKWTNRDGSPLSLAVSFSAPYMLIVDGDEVQDFKADLRAAMSAYDKLVAERNDRAGRLPVLMGTA